MTTNDKAIEETKKWITNVVIACNFCPFAANVIKQQSVFFGVELSLVTNICIERFQMELIRLDEDISIDTSFLIFPYTFNAFDEYLKMIALAESFIRLNGYDGIYQLASFHPNYLFSGSIETDAANYTNRSIYPMLHILRESSIDLALNHYAHTEDIPNTNIKFTEKHGLLYMQMLRDSCKY